MSTIYWREAAWLWVALLPLLLPLLNLVGRKRKLSTIIDPALLPWALEKSAATRGQVRRALLALAWILFVIALAGPRTVRWVPPELRPATASMVAIVDFSASMLADDARPTRKAQAIASLDRILGQENSNMAIGLGVFAGHGHLLLPPTQDTALLRSLVSQLDALRTPTLGNNLAEALQTAAEKLQNRAGYRAILLLSDGDIDEAAVASAIAVIEDKLQADNIRLFVIGVGGSEKVALSAALATDTLHENRSILTRQEKPILKTLAQSGGGKYYPIEQLGDATIAELIQQPAPRIDPKDQGQIVWNEWFFLPLLAGLFLLLSTVMRPEQKNNPLLLAALGIFFLLTIPSKQSSAAPDPQQRLKNGDYISARELFSQQEGYIARFGEGVACYRLRDWVCARQAFSRAAWLATNDRQRARAVFNLGNAHFQLGEFEEAAVLFEQAHILGVDQAATRRNLEFANELADALRKYRIHLDMVQRKADWQSNARDIPEGLLERLTEGIWLKLQTSSPQIIEALGRDRVNQLIEKGVARALGIAPTAKAQTSSWSGNNASLAPENSIGLFNRLLPLEAGLGVMPEKPYRLKGVRPW